MPKVALHRQSDIEKRLKSLESQLYGKQTQPIIGTSLGQKISEIPTNHVVESTQTSDVVYLKKDLTKISLLASLAIGIQLIIYFSHLIDRIKFF